MKTAAILGSVVLKKAFDFLDKRVIKSVLYAPKLSLAALGEHHAAINIEKLAKENLDAFTRGVIGRDFGKTFQKELSGLNPDFLVIDLLDDIADLLVDPASCSVVTKSNYLSRLNLADYGVDKWQSVARDSEYGWSLWQKGCEALARSIPQGTQVVLVHVRQPERYAGDAGAQCYSQRLLDRVRRNNALLERAYQMLSGYVNCVMVDVPAEVLISQTVEAKGFNPADFGEAGHSRIAGEIAGAMGLQSSVIPSLHDRVEELFDVFGAVLKQDVPSISELHAMGCRYLERGDVEKARWAERLIVLLKNSSVPLSVEMGKVMFGYGGIGTVIHAQCKIGDFVNIGTNVTLGGGRSQVGADGKIRQIPHVGNRVYIATGAKLLGGITVGDHSIIGANAVVTRDVPPLSVVAGNPAEVIAKITPATLSKYASYLYKGVPLREVERLVFGKV